MGYYTYYSMEARNIKDEEQYNAIIEEMKKMELYAFDDHNGVFDSSEYHETTHDADFDSYDEFKWYDNEYDMVKLSKLFPNVTFKLHGDGEERGDMWNKYFHNGESEECGSHIIYDKPCFIEWEE